MTGKQKWSLRGFFRYRDTGLPYLVIDRHLPSGHLDHIDLTEDELLTIVVDAATKLQDIRIWTQESQVSV